MGREQVAVSVKRDVRAAAEPQWCCSRNASQRRTSLARFKLGSSEQGGTGRQHGNLQ